MPTIETYVFIAASGERERGAPGVVWVDAERGRAEYLKLEEIENDQLRSGMEDMIVDDENENFFICHKQGENAHVFKYPRRKALQEIMGGAIRSPVEDDRGFEARGRE